MKEIADILQAWRQCIADSRPAALATVVAVEGSSYRRPGARMLILGDSSTKGSISGGCIERDAIYRAGAFVAGSNDGTIAEAIVVRYDSVSEEEAGPGASLGCGGTIDVLMERVALPAGALRQDVLALLDPFFIRRQSGIIATVIAQRNSEFRIGSHFVFGEDGSPASEDCPDYLSSEARAALESDQSRQFRQEFPGGWIDFFLEIIHPPPQLFIFGAGNDAMPLATFAKSIGWRVVVVDLRSSTAAAGRVFDADAVVRQPAGELSKLEIPANSAAIVMNHNWNHDLASLRHLTNLPLSYLGVLGPRRRTERLLSHLLERTAAARHFSYPIGLDIGAESPQEVALSIIAEIIAVSRNSSGGRLSDKPGPIHNGTVAVSNTITENSCPVAAS